MTAIPIYYDTLTNRWGYREDLVLLEATDLELAAVARDDVSPQYLLKASTEQKPLLFTEEDVDALTKAIQDARAMDGNFYEYMDAAIQLVEKLRVQL